MFLMSDKEPKYFDLLTKPEQAEYKALQKMFHSNIGARFGFATTFGKIFNYIYQEKTRVWIRNIVVGIFWVDGNIVINRKQLSILICQARSSINAHLADLGFIATRSSRLSQDQFLTYFKDHLDLVQDDYKQWSFRYWKGNLTGNDRDPDLLNETQENQDRGHGTSGPAGPIGPIGSCPKAAQSSRPVYQASQNNSTPKESTHRAAQMIQPEQPSQPAQTEPKGPTHRKRKIILVPPLKEITAVMFLKWPGPEDFEDIQLDPYSDHDYESLDNEQFVEPRTDIDDLTLEYIELINTKFTDELPVIINEDLTSLGIEGLDL